MLKDVATEDWVHPVGVDLKRRRALGIYYTPRSAAAMLARWAIRSESDTVLEPSFGGCTILDAALSQLRLLGCPNPAKQIFGFDVDESAFAYLRRLIGADKGTQFSLQNFLGVLPGHPTVTTVIANPPFVSYHRMNDEQRKSVRAWRERHAPPFALTASLWAYFLMHSLAFLTPNGRLAFVLPSAAISSDYAQPIMNMLGKRFAQLTLYRVSEQLFIQTGAEERTVVLLAEGYLREGNTKSSRSERSVTNLEELERLLWASASNTYSMDKQAISTSSVDTADLTLDKAMASGSLRMLGETVNVAIGEVIGDTDFFVKPMDEWEALRIPTRYLRPIVTRMRQIAGLRVTKREVSALYSGIPLLIAPPERKIPKSVRSYLDRYPRNVQLQNKTFAKRNPWYKVSYDTTASAFIGSLSHESPKIALNSAGISCANGLYKLTPKQGCEWHSWLAAASLTTVFRVSAEKHARIRGSGALKLEPSNVSKLVIPADVPSLDAAGARVLLNRLDDLVRQGEYESATREADDALLIASGILNPSELSVIRDCLQDLRGGRLRPGQRCTEEM